MGQEQNETKEAPELYKGTTPVDIPGTLADMQRRRAELIERYNALGQKIQILNQVIVCFEG